MSTQLLRRLGTVSVAFLLATSAFAVTLDDLIDRLDADDLVTRDSATDELRKRLTDDTDEQTVEAARALEREAADALRTRDLSLEQRIRLLDALRDRFFRSPRGAMGVRFNGPRVGMVGVEILQAIQGFPAAESGALKNGDVITSVAGVSLIGPEFVIIRGNGLLTAAQELLKHIVISHDPGQVLEMTLVRPLGPIPQPAQDGPNIPLVPGGGDLITEGPGKNAEVLTVQVPLAPFDQLGQGTRLDEQTLEGAWTQRAERLGIPKVTSRSLGTPLTLGDWIAHRRAPRQDAPPMLLAGGGQAGVDEFGNNVLAGVTFPVNELQVQQMPAPIEERLRRAARLNPARVRDIGQPKAAWRVPQGQPIIVQGPGVDDIMVLLQNIGNLSKQKETLLARAADPTIGDKQRRANTEEAARIQAVIDGMEQVLKQKIDENAKAQQKK